MLKPMELPTVAEIDAASEFLRALAREHGLSNLRHGSEPGQIVVDVDPGRGYFDVVRFIDDVEDQLGFRSYVVVASAPAARPGRPIGSDTHVA
jgi:predicted methyltransferase